MADNSFPRDVKLPMGDDLDDDAPPPPFSHNHDAEAAVPLLAAEKGTAPSPTHADSQPEEQPRSRCPFFKGRFRRGRCTSEQRAQRKTKARKFLRRLLIALLAVWAYMSFFGDFDDEDWSLIDPEQDGMPSHGVPRSWLRPAAPQDQASLVFSQVEDIAGSECTREMVPWDGPSIIETDLQRLRINFGKGNLVSNVIVRTGEVDVPTLLVRANVTKTHHSDDDDEDDEDDEEEEDVKAMIKRHGLHLEFAESEDALDVSFWADRYVRGGKDGEDSPPEHPPHHKHPHHKHPHRKHPHHKHPHHKHPHHKHPHHKHPHHKHPHGKHPHDQDDGDHEEMKMMERADMEMYEPEHGRRYKRFCATIEVEVLLPASEDSHYSLVVDGVILSTKVEEVDGVSFDELVLRSVVGEIKTGDIRANALIAEVVTGHAIIESVQVSTEGNPLFAVVRSTVGNLKVNAKTGNVVLPDDDDDNEGGDGDDDEDDYVNELGEIKRPRTHHVVIAGATAGSVELDISLASHDNDNDDDKDDVRAKGETVPGMLAVRARTSTGRVHSTINLADDQQLNFKSTSSSGKISAKISDKFLGHLAVGSILGSAEVTEAEESDSVIEYEKNTIHSKVGHKVIDGADNEASRVEGKVELGTALGEARLEFF